MAYFSSKSFKFLRALARNNSREWFQAHKAHLAREKELTRLRERIAAERRVPVELQPELARAHDDTCSAPAARREIGSETNCS